MQNLCNVLYLVAFSPGLNSAASPVATANLCLFESLGSIGTSRESFTSDKTSLTHVPLLFNCLVLSQNYWMDVVLGLRKVGVFLSYTITF